MCISFEGSPLKQRTTWYVKLDGHNQLLRFWPWFFQAGDLPVNQCFDIFVLFLLIIAAIPNSVLSELESVKL